MTSAKKQMEAMQEEVFKADSAREEAQVKAEMLEKQLEESQNREAEMQVRLSVSRDTAHDFFSVLLRRVKSNPTRNVWIA